MSKILLAWEIGGGFGHVGQMAPLAHRLAARGHEIAVALREPRHGTTLFAGHQLFAAPRETPGRSDRIVEPNTFADILHNAGACDADMLKRIIAAWRAIFEQARPDILVLDFSPLAFLAAQGYTAKTVLLATGHATPPDVAPLPDCCSWRNSYPDRLRRTEQRVHDALSQQLSAKGQAPLQRVAELFTRATANWLTTFPELDHYSQRPAGRHEYVGVWSELPAVRPHWPVGNGPRVFAYLKTSPLAAQVLAELDRRSFPTVAFVPDATAMGLPANRGSICISPEPIDIGIAAHECDMAILHAGHNATARMLLAGKPILALPLSGEQQSVASNIARLGAGEWLHPERLELLPRSVDQLLSVHRYRVAAEAFAQRYAAWTPDRQLAQVVDRLDRLATSTSGCA